ncbi:RagB/SusD family nutrient uptake outer membrane protein [Mucilaginibacter sp. PAMB04274]|uniref:RagB/SusD family nutrient uptake outer membrane protein n=1 Tax=Mucilaginibacter sp. PAMB04274 TaxID=3138568 RepID=UPI0031F70CFB
MKLFRNILTIASVGIMMMSSCKDADFLAEQPTDVLLTSNALLNKAQFDVMSASMYRNVQLFYNSADGTKDAWILGLGTDVCFDPRDASTKFNNWSIVTAQDNYTNDWFNSQYNIIKIANTLISGAANPEVTWASEAIKNATIAEARFFRGFAYRNLANIFGGVPIVDKPVAEAKDDFVRNSREECWAFAKADLEFARTYLPLTTTSPGRVVRAAADHFLSEVNISLKDYDGAIAAATRVIDGTDGNFSLVKARFGARAAEADKNYYYDLFVMGNQNTQAGNNEGLMVAQFEVTPTGGVVNGGVPSFSRPLIERMMWCNYWGLAKIGYTTGVAVDSTGRGVGFVRPTNYTNYTIWRNAGNDIRNSEVCIKRKYYFGPGIAPSTGFKPKDLIPKSFLTTRDDTMIYVFPNWCKFGTDKHINAQPDNGYVRDFYVARLSETYLLRAEAYLGKGLTSNAAADINVVRARAQAPLITSADVSIDYILDERARELYGEEFRILTLGRLGLVYDRTKRYGSPESAASIQQFNNLMPIPQTAIDRNIGAKINQNPGY